MTVKQQIDAYIESQPDSKRGDLRALHQLTLQTLTGCKLWFLDGKDEHGKTVSNPNIGYGQQTMTYADGSKREFYQVGLSANSTGISVYVMGLKDKTYLKKKWAGALGKANVTGYCIKFKALKDIDVDVLMDAMQDGVAQTQ